MPTALANADQEFLNIDFRDELRPSQAVDELNISGQELLNVLASFRNYGLWRLNLETQKSTWSEDVYRIYGMAYTPGRIDLDYAMGQYHPDDRPYLARLLDDAVAHKSGFQFVLRLKGRGGRYKLVQSIGKYRERADGARELYGVFSEFQPAVRMIGAAV